MVIYLGSDHQGFALKKIVMDFLRSEGYEIADMGAVTYDEQDDYPLIAQKVAERVSANVEQSKGILICGSGAGVAMVANKFKNIKAGYAGNSDQAFDIRNDDDVNILCLGSNYIPSEEAQKIVHTWITTPFSGEERHRRRLEEIRSLELKNFSGSERNIHGNYSGNQFS